VDGSWRSERGEEQGTAVKSHTLQLRTANVKARYVLCSQAIKEQK